MACHNRRELTLRCLEHLDAACRQSSGNVFDVWLVDDGSSDGTTEAVKARFPGVNVVRGDGGLFWAKGMHKAWTSAVAFRQYDFYLWLNDDVVLRRDSLSTIFADYESVGGVLVGACSMDETERQCTYGATDRRDQKIIPNGHPQRADGWFNGNCVLVPRDVALRVGLISEEYSHARADYDYAERLKRAGVPI